MYSLMFMRDEVQKSKDLKEMAIMFKGFNKDSLITYMGKTKYGKKFIEEWGVAGYKKYFREHLFRDLKTLAYEQYRRGLK